jgi:hypothetical protein
MILTSIYNEAYFEINIWARIIDRTTLRSDGLSKYFINTYDQESYRIILI